MNLNTASGGSVAVSEVAFGKDFNEPLVHQVVVAYLAGGRQGSKAQKSRSAVAGGGKKPWRQKGTGRARAGTIRSPLWRGGGKTFAAVPRDHGQKVNQKMYRAALRCILSELVRQERLLLVDNIDLAEPKTRLLATQLKEWGTQGALIVTDKLEDNLTLAARNLPHVDVRDTNGVDPVSLVGFDKVVMTVPALKQFEERLA